MDSYFQQSREYLRRILTSALLDHSAFEQKISACELQVCKATCCHDGVQLSKKDAELVDSLAREKLKTTVFFKNNPLKTYIEPSASGKWKTCSRTASTHELASDFPAHFPKTRCVFLDENHHCSLQKLAVEEKRDPWHYKPFTCWIHPISIQQRDGDTWLTLINSSNDPQQKSGYPGYGSCTHCGRKNQSGEPAHHVLAIELTRLGDIAGRDFLAELRSPSVDWEYNEE